MVRLSESATNPSTTTVTAVEGGRSRDIKVFIFVDRLTTNQVLFLRTILRYSMKLLWLLMGAGSCPFSLCASVCGYKAKNVAGAMRGPST